MKRLLGAAIICAGMAIDARANLISNGSFEFGTAPGASLSVPAGSTAITGWTITDGGVDYIGTTWVASHGARSIDLNRLTPGGVQQLVTGLTVGYKYLISFDMAGNTAGPPTIKTLDVSTLGGPALSQVSFSFNITGSSSSNMHWTKYLTSFVATTPSVTIKFLSTTTSGAPQRFGPALDNVLMVSGVPAPAALPMLLTGIPGIAGISWFLRRARKSRSTASA